MTMPNSARSVGTCLMVASVLAVLLAASAPAGATTLRRMDLPELTAMADRIVHARAVQNRVYWDPAGRIYTDTVFDVITDAKGAGPPKFTVTQLGGRIDPIEMQVEGTPTFAVGEEVVLFTEQHPGAGRLIVGLSQGVMRVHTDPDTGEQLVVSEAPGMGVTFVGGRPQRSVATLQTLLDRVRQINAAGGQGAGLSRKPSRDAVAPGGAKP